MQRRLASSHGRGRYVIAIFLAMPLAACEASGNDTQPLPEGWFPDQSVKLASYEKQPDGTFKAVEHTISFEEFSAMQAHRLAKGQQASSDSEETQQALSYLGTGDTTNQPPPCWDDRTTWLYGYDNRLGCVGGGSGSLDLAAIGWAYLKSIWVSNTYSVRLCGQDRNAPKPWCCGGILGGCYQWETFVQNVQVCAGYLPWTQMYIGNSVSYFTYTDPYGATCTASHPSPFVSIDHY